MSVKCKDNQTSEKLKVDVYVPLSQCACMYEHFINSVFSILMEYMKYIEFETKSLDSDDAKKLNLHGNCVVLEGSKVIAEPYRLKREISSLLKLKGLI
ncbi:MAG: hypothetical protein ACTSQ8_13075 [Candidatus Helarchaeota archaeon]